MISVGNARDRIRAAMPLMTAEQVMLGDAFGRILAENLVARRTQPPHSVSAMDGYAVKASDVAELPVNLNIVAEIPAGKAFNGNLDNGEAARIFTGAPVPHGADTIVIQENTKRHGMSVDVLDGEAPVGRYIRPAGLDFEEGEILLKPGRQLTARDVGLAAGMNIPWVKVRRKPRIALLATGDEVVMPGDYIGANQIVSSNGLALKCLVLACGAEPVDLGIAPDSKETLRTMAESARSFDMLVTTGGASVGDHDLVKEVLGDIGLEIDFWRIAMRPGKPLMFGNIHKTRMLGLPGNPVSALVCATIFLRPAINAMLGKESEPVTERNAVLTKGLPKNDEREDYIRAQLDTGEDGVLHATAFEKQDSSIFSGLAKADCLIIRPPFAPPANSGEIVRIVPLSESGLNI